MMTIHRSHRMEVLARDLCEALRDTDGRDPFVPEWVVVPSRGMERWAAMQVAQDLGVAANVRWMFLGPLVQAVTNAVLRDTASGAWGLDHVAWTLADLWPDLLARPKFAPLAEFAGKPDPGTPARRREVVLARRLAEVLDRYQVYRPDLVLAWDRGEGEPGWQAEVWRAVRSRLGAPDPAERLEQCLRALATGAPALDGVPFRICFFGFSTIPPRYLHVLQALARHRDVVLFAFAPCAEWFQDALSPREADRARRRSGTLEVAATPAGQVHPLLAAFGRLSRDFQDALAELEGQGCATREDWEQAWVAGGPGAARTLLEHIQNDILNGTLPERPHPVPPGDRSIRIHACHGPMRQVEVLRDALLALFQEDPTLEPRDVLVMTPDIETYAPLVEAVFGDGCGDAGFPRIPYQIADRGLARENPAAAVVARFLDLARGRLPASRVLDLLAMPPVARRFTMTADDLARVRLLVREAGIRFGLDADDRARMGLPRADEHTWRFGLDRLLLGFAMGSEGGAASRNPMFADVLPCDLAAGGAGGTLARFIAFCDALLDLVRRARSPRTAAEWASFTDEVLARLVATGDDAQVLAARRCARMDVAPTRSLDLEAWAAVWEAQSTAHGGTHAFFQGGVTFAALVPLRNLPFRVIALLGLDDEVFPRSPASLSFDRMARERRPGDRSPRDEDLQLFLEAILAARQSFLIACTGVGNRDNRPVPFAGPVAQLLDALDASFEGPGGRKAREHVIAYHPLQPFSPRVFSRPDVPAFDRRLLAAATTLLSSESVEPRPRFDRPLAPPGGGVLRPEDLGSFLQHPTRFLIRRLGFRPQPEQVSVEDRGPVVLDAFERHEVGEEILAAALKRGEGRDLLLHRLRRAGALPPGVLAGVEFGVIEDLARPLLRQAHDLVGGPIEGAAVDLEVGDLRIQGVLPGVSDRGLVAVTFSASCQARLLRLWVRHLIATLVVPSCAGQAVLVSRSGVHRLGPLAPEPGQAGERARSLLATLLDLYRVGLRTPLPLFARASYAFAEAAMAGGRDKALAAARRSWTEDPGGERADPFVRFAFGDVDSPEDAKAPGAPAFEDLAGQVHGPLLEALAGAEGP